MSFTRGLRHLRAVLAPRGGQRPARRRDTLGAATQRLSLVLLTFVLSSAAPAFAQPKDVAQLYGQLKTIENQTNFPLPAPSATVNVGTFDAATNKFDGLVTEVADPPDDKKKGGKPGPKIVPVEKVNAVNAELVFAAVNHKTTVTFFVNGQAHIIPKGQKSVTADVGMATEVKWSVQSGGKVHYRDTLQLERPRVIGAGVFTVPALPVALVYEPPQGQLKKNSARYVKIRSEGATVRISFSTEGSTTTPADTDFDDVLTVKNALSLAAKGFNNSKDPIAQGIAKGLNLLASGLGSASASFTQGTTVTKDHTLAVRNSVTSGFTTAAREGPGAGDVIIYLRNARLVWLAQGGRVRLAFLGAEGQVSATVKEFRAELTTLPTPTSRSKRFGLDRATIEALLATDPFVADGPKATLAAARFRQIEVFEMHGSQAFDYEFAFAVDQSDLQGQTSFTTKSEDHRKGFLSYIGIGVPDTATIKTTTKYGTSTESKAGEEVRVSGHFETQSGEDFAVTAFYDRAFGTLAFVPVALGAQQVTGVVTDASGKPLARQPVKLVAGGKKFATVTDSQGRYSFRAPGIAKGSATLTTGTASQQVMIGSTPMPNVELRLKK
jgi:hypothetical protein